jgi:hypothetical protein
MRLIGEGVRPRMKQANLANDGGARGAPYVKVVSYGASCVRGCVILRAYFPSREVDL